MEKPNSFVTADFNGDFYYVCTMSQGMLGYAEPEAPPHYLDPNVDDATLGHTLRLALQASKKVSVEEFQQIFHSGIVQQLGKEREAWKMKHYGYKTKRALYKNMDTCSVSVFDGKIEIQPTHRKSLDGYTVKKDTGPFPFYIAVDATDAELGAALREGFKRCTSAIK